jgi:LPXTG-site transpeptidase (sortase) family protein
MSNYWLPVLAAFSWGMTAAYGLEAIWRFRSGNKRPWPFLGLALACAGLALFIGNYELGIMNYEAEEITHHASQPALKLLKGITGSPISATLPTPLVRNYELGIRNDEGEEVTLRTSQPALKPLKGITDFALPITDYRLPITTKPTRLHIPAFKINRPVVTVPLVDGAWDVAHLGGDVGLLATAGQYPGDDLAMVFAGHMTFADGRLLYTGAFAELQYATYGTEIVVQMEGGETAVYQVSEIRRIAPNDVDALYLADGDSILLLTCTDWNDSTNLYTNRLLIRATRTVQVLVDDKGSQEIERLGD